MNSFDASRRCDVVVVTSPATDRAEFVAWSYLMQMLRLSVGFWDSERCAFLLIYVASTPTCLVSCDGSCAGCLLLSPMFVT